MRWEERLLAELDDLEQQAEGLHLAERDAVVAELAVSHYADVEFASRLHASVGQEVRLVLLGASAVEGVVRRVGSDWLLVGSAHQEQVVRLGAVVRARGLSPRSVPEEARGVAARLGLGSVLRRVSAEGDEVTVVGVDGSSLSGQVRRVGADFFELATTSADVELVNVGALALLRR